MYRTNTTALEAGQHETFELSTFNQRPQRRRRNPRNLPYYLLGYKPDPTKVFGNGDEARDLVRQIFQGSPFQNHFVEEATIFDNDIRLGRPLKLPVFAINVVPEHTRGSFRLSATQHRVNSFEELDNHLSSMPSERFGHQMIFFGYQRPVFSNSLGFVRRHFHWLRMRRRYLAVEAMILVLIGFRWNIGFRKLQELTEFPRKSRLEGPFEIQLPSEVPRSSTDPDLKDAVINLRFTTLPDPFTSNRQYYLWKPHLRSPSCEYMTIIFDEVQIEGPLNQQDHVLRDTFPSQLTRSIISASTYSILFQFFGKLDYWPRPTEGRSEIRLRTLKIKHSAHLLEVATRHWFDHEWKALIGIRQMIFDQQFDGRRSPSYSRINFLLHLKDCVSNIEKDVFAMTQSPPIWKMERPPFAKDHWFSVICKDAEAMLKTTKELQQMATDMQKMIQDQLNAQYSYRAAILTILATVYVPLSLATGIFGMNIKEINNGTPKWWAVVAVGLPLVLITIVVPLSFDFVFSKLLLIVRSRLFRMLVILLAGAVFTALFVSGTMLPWHIDTIPTACILIYCIWKAWQRTSRVNTWFYYLFSLYVFLIGFLNSFLGSIVTLPFFLLMPLILWLWWQRLRMIDWLKSRKTQPEGEQSSDSDSNGDRQH